jgi:hypothetical protein
MVEFRFPLEAAFLLPLADQLTKIIGNAFNGRIVLAEILAQPICSVDGTDKAAGFLAANRMKEN